MHFQNINSIYSRLPKKLNIDYGFDLKTKSEYSNFYKNCQIDFVSLVMYYVIIFSFGGEYESKGTCKKI